MSKVTNIGYVQKKLGDVLEVTHGLAEVHPVASEKRSFVRIIEFTFRRSYYTLLAIYKLSEHKDLADSASALSRKLVEDAVFIEFMIQEGKEQLSETFNNFVYVQVHDELKLMKKLGFLSKEQQVEFQSLEVKYNEVKEQFKKENGQKFNSPFGTGFEDMLRRLKFNEGDKSRLLLAYVRGSAKIHLNPADLISFKTDEFRNEEIQQSMVQSIIITIWAFSRLTTRYIDEIREILDKDVYDDVAKKVTGIFDDYPGIRIQDK